MDLGKMLADALQQAATGDEQRRGKVGKMHEDNRCDLDGCFNLTAAAEAFLAKVREAEKPTVVSEIGMSHDGESPYMRIALRFPSHGQAVTFYNQTVRRRRETSLRLYLQADPDMQSGPDQPGSVPYMEEVE